MTPKNTVTYSCYLTAFRCTGRLTHRIEGCDPQNDMLHLLINSRMTMAMRAPGGAVPASGV
jgi:hypothetical protein